MKKCNNCGKESDSKFCSYCGAEIKEIPVAESVSKPEAKIESEIKEIPVAESVSKSEAKIESELNNSESVTYTATPSDNPTKEKIENSSCENVKSKKKGASSIAWLVILLLIFCCPAGLILMWAIEEFTLPVRIIITVIIVMLFLC